MFFRKVWIMGYFFLLSHIWIYSKPTKLQYFKVASQKTIFKGFYLKKNTALVYGKDSRGLCIYLYSTEFCSDLDENCITFQMRISTLHFIFEFFSVIQKFRKSRDFSKKKFFSPPSFHCDVNLGIFHENMILFSSED